jgi:hypothetical protein
MGVPCFRESIPEFLKRLQITIDFDPISLKKIHEFSHIIREIKTAFIE